MGLANFSAEEATSSTKITLEVDDDLTNNSDYAESKISDLANIKGIYFYNKQNYVNFFSLLH